MKKTLSVLLLAFAMIFTTNAMAQKPNSFKGIIVTSASGGGNTRTQEYKVFENKVLIQQQGQTVVINDKILTTTLDLSQIYMMVKGAGMGDDLPGNGKFALSDTLNLDSIFSDNYKVTYADETKKIQGFDAKKAVIALKSDESGETQEITVWYSPEIGPEYNSIPPFVGVKGFILEYSIKIPDGTTMEMTTTEITKGKVKAVDMLLPAGYETISKEKLEEIGKIIQSTMGGGGE